MESGSVSSTHQGLSITVNSGWIVEGEDRLSYTTLIRLVECCRELHWNSDVLLYAEGLNVDSITKLINGNFLQPILAGSTILITYDVTAVRRKSYELRFEVRNRANHALCAVLSIVSVFYNPTEHQTSTPPRTVLDHLSDMVKTRQSEVGKE